MGAPAAVILTQGIASVVGAATPQRSQSYTAVPAMPTHLAPHLVVPAETAYRAEAERVAKLPPAPPRTEVAGMLVHQALPTGVPAEVGQFPRPFPDLAELVAMQLRWRRPAGASATSMHPAPRMAAPAEMGPPSVVTAVTAGMQQQQPLPRL